jgi:hypothetical protein
LSERLDVIYGILGLLPPDDLVFKAISIDYGADPSVVFLRLMARYKPVNYMKLGNALITGLRLSRDQIQKRIPGAFSSQSLLCFPAQRYERLPSWSRYHLDPPDSHRWSIVERRFVPWEVYQRHDMEPDTPGIGRDDEAYQLQPEFRTPSGIIFTVWLIRRRDDPWRFISVIFLSSKKEILSSDFPGSASVQLTCERILKDVDWSMQPCRIRVRPEVLLDIAWAWPEGRRQIDTQRRPFTYSQDVNVRR